VAPPLALADGNQSIQIREDAGVLFNSDIYTVSIPHVYHVLNIFNFFCDVLSVNIYDDAETGLTTVISSVGLPR